MKEIRISLLGTTPVNKIISWSRGSSCFSQKSFDKIDEKTDAILSAVEEMNHTVVQNIYFAAELGLIYFFLMKDI